MMIWLLLGLIVPAALLTPRVSSGGAWVEWMARSESKLQRYGPLVAAILSILAVWWVWDPPPAAAAFHDQASYLLQARIFASGRWTVPTPPLPEFFEQPHVLLVPAVASKYPPGHALLLAIGAAVRLPVLVPLILTGVTAALLFTLTTRIANAFVAVFAWVFWLTAPLVLRFQGSFFSEISTSALVLASWWALLNWRDSRRSRWLMLLALAVGWGAITRPLTMLAFALPIGILVIRDTLRLRAWRDFALALLLGIAVLSILPIWSAKTTGSWRLSPVAVYRRDYLPFDKPGFRADTTAPHRAASMDPVLRAMYDHFMTARKEQTADAVPRLMGLRLVNLAIGFFQGSRLVMLPFALVGLFAGGAALRFAAISALTVFVAYLPYAHWEKWTLYYLEITPVVAALCAAGFWRIAVQLHGTPERSRVAVTAAAVALILVSARSIERWRREHHGTGTFYREFASSLERLPSQPAIVFVRYSQRAPHHVAVVRNQVDLRSAPVWVVHDLGARNAQLQRLAPNRSVHFFDEDQIVPPPPADR
jgi:hypothetical protein